MVLIRPRFLALVSLCALTSLSWAAPSKEDGVQMRRALPTDPAPVGALPGVPSPIDNKSVDVKVETSNTPAEKNADHPKESTADHPKESTANPPKESTANQDSTAKDKPPTSSNQPTSKKPATGSTHHRRTLVDNMDQADLDKRSSQTLYLRDCRLHNSPGWLNRHNPFCNRKRIRKHVRKPQGWKHVWKPQGWEHNRKQSWGSRRKSKNVQVHSHIHSHAHIHKYVNKHHR